MKKKCLPVLTMSLLTAGLLLGCGSNSDAELARKPEQIKEYSVVEPAAESKTEETQQKFNINEDVLFSYNYNGSGNYASIHKIVAKDVVERGKGHYYYGDFEVTYDTSGYFKSMHAERDFDYAIFSLDAEYNTDGQIISLTVTEKQDRYTTKYHYDVVYNSSDGYIKVYATRDNWKYTKTLTYDSNYNLVSIEDFYEGNYVGKYIYRRVYEEYSNGTCIHKYEYNDRNGQLVYEEIYYENGKLSEKYFYDEETGDLKTHLRY